MSNGYARVQGDPKLQRRQFARLVLTIVRNTKYSVVKRGSGLAACISVQYLRLISYAFLVMTPMPHRALLASETMMETISRSRGTGWPINDQ